MTFRDFCDAIGDGVLSCVPGAKFQARDQGDGAAVTLAGAKATITRETPGWRVTFSRPGGAAKSPLAGNTVSAATADTIAGVIAGFLI